MATPKFPNSFEEEQTMEGLAEVLADRHMISKEWALRFVRASYRITQLLCHKQRGYGPGNIQTIGERGVFGRVREKAARLENLRKLHPLGLPYDDKREEEDDIAGLAVIMGMLRETEWPDVEPGNAF